MSVTEKRPGIIKLRLNLAGSTSKTESASDTTNDTVKPKLVLSVRRPDPTASSSSTEKAAGGLVTIASDDSSTASLEGTIKSKRGRKKKLNPDGTLVHPPPDPNHQKRAYRKRARTETDGVIVSSKSVSDSTAKASAPVPSTASMMMTGKVPIQAANPVISRPLSSAISSSQHAQQATGAAGMKPEEHLIQRVLSQVLATFFQAMTVRNVDIPFDVNGNIREMASRILPYWLFYSVRDEMSQIVHMSEPVDFSEQALRVNSELDLLVKRLQTYEMPEQQEQQQHRLLVPTELRILEQQQYLQDEKLLGANMKRLYDERVQELLQLRRSAQ